MCFSFEKYVPYNPNDKRIEVGKIDTKNEVTVSDDTENVTSEKQNEKLIEDKHKEEEENEIIETVLKHQLNNIENFLQDDYSKAKYVQIEEEFLEQVETKVLHSSDENLCPKFSLILMLILTRTLAN